LVNPIKNWNKKKIWIIGASFGIGRSLAEILAKEGAQLVLSGRTKIVLEELKSLLPDQNKMLDSHVICPIDVRSKESIEESFHYFLKDDFDIDCIIYCAGTYHPGAFLEGSDLDFDQTLDTNFMGAVRLLHVIAPRVSRNNPCQIVFLGSVAAYSGLPNSNVYGPSKAALLNFCEGMKIELEPKGIDIRIVSPGFVSTRLTDKNQFPMPFKISSHEAATSILKGLATSSFNIDFPNPMSLFLRFLRLLPYRIYFWFARKAR
jgi:short-subunit dehydrogenase